MKVLSNFLRNCLILFHFSHLSNPQDTLKKAIYCKCRLAYALAFNYALRYLNRNRRKPAACAIQEWLVGGVSIITACRTAPILDFNSRIVFDLILAYTLKSKLSIVVVFDSPRKRHYQVPSTSGDVIPRD